MGAPQITQLNCHKLQEAIKDTNLAKLISNARNTSLDMIKREQSELPAKRKELRDLQAKLEGYSDEIALRVSKVETKKSLTENLPWYIAVIGVLSLLSIAAVRLFPEPVMLEWVASGQLIQFVTVMILLSTIMALGLAGILGENIIGTLLGGIGGYVLSQGIGRAAARVAARGASTGAGNSNPG